MSSNNSQFPRHLFKNEADIIRTNLHTFRDASEEADAVVGYIRNTYNDGSSIIRQVKAATKLAPNKAASIPKGVECSSHSSTGPQSR